MYGHCSKDRMVLAHSALPTKPAQEGGTALDLCLTEEWTMGHGSKLHRANKEKPVCRAETQAHGLQDVNQTLRYTTSPYYLKGRPAWAGNSSSFTFELEHHVLLKPFLIPRGGHQSVRQQHPGSSRTCVREVACFRPVSPAKIINAMMNIYHGHPTSWPAVFIHTFPIFHNQA